MPTVRIGSKAFTESVILGEMLRVLAEQSGAEASHLAELGGTQVLWKALGSGSIDAYVEYTGTIGLEIFAGQTTDEAGMRKRLRALGLGMSNQLGFNNTYALGMREKTAEQLRIRTISDLARHPELRLGISEEFLERKDGWPGLKHFYGLPQTAVRSLDHVLAYRGLKEGTHDLSDFYSTDAEASDPELRLLVDDRHYFPDYHAVVLYRLELEQQAPTALRSMLRLEGQISNEAMARMNAQAKLDRVPEGRIAVVFLNDQLGLRLPLADQTNWARMLEQLSKNTREHLFLVLVSLTAAVLTAIPLGVLSAKRPNLGKVVLAIVGIIQTLPSLALLVFMIPLLGLGAWPAIVALFLYSLLPIVRNTATGLQEIPSGLHESALALGLPPWARLWRVELPLASRSILGGIKTAAVINVGTATLGALIGAGGYGQPIQTGIRLNDVGLILQGAVPAALLALAVQGLFGLLERVLVPRGLRL
jgi:osmoprotectant transport system permease protein